MIEPRKPEPEIEQPEDDLGLDVDIDEQEEPEDNGGELGTEEGRFEPEGDEDLELDEVEVVIGLDALNGLDDEPVDDEDTLAEDERSWMDDAGTEELVAEEDAEDESERWTEGSEPAGDEGFDDDLELSDAAGSAVDTGDEGFADEQLLTGLDMDALPALEQRPNDEEDGADPIERELLEELAAATPDEAAGAEVAPIAAAWTRLRDGAAPALLSVAGELCAAWDAGLWLARSDDVALAKVAGPDSIAHALAVSVGASVGSAWLAATTPRGVCVSRDGGRTFGAPLRTADQRAVPAFVAFTRDAAGLVLWTAAPFGRLHVLREGAEELVDAGLELPVAKLASDGQQSLLVVGRSDDGALRAVMSPDGGRGWKPLALPADSVERLQVVAVAGESWLCSRRGLRPQLLWGRRGEAGLPLGPNASAPVVLSVERGATYAYFCEAEAGRGKLLRVELRSGIKAPRVEALAELPADLGTPLQVAVGRNAQGHVQVYVAGTRALYRALLAAPPATPAATKT